MKKQLILYAVLMLCFSTAAVEAADVKFHLGNVTITRKNKIIPVKINSQVLPGDIIKTGENGVIIISLAKNRLIKLNQNSSLIIQTINTNKDYFSLKLSAGSIFSKLAKTSKSTRFNIKAQTSLAAVRGTEFFFAFGKKNVSQHDLWLCVNEGKVSIKNTNTQKEKIVKKGEGIFIEKGESLTTPKPYKWTNGLNWNFDNSKGTVIDKVRLEDAYTDLLDYDYD